jgi:hypothetical protein
MNDISTLKQEFKSIVQSNIHRDGITNLMLWLESTDFYEAPSSVRYHGSEPGGLLAHSLQVYKRLKEKQVDESDETIAITALFHDLCKVNFYKPSFRNVKNEVTGKWERVPSYEYNETSVPLGHGEKSMYLVMKYMQLTDEEACAIRWHMSGYVLEPMYERPAITNALHKYKLVLKLQSADSESSFWDCK